MTDAAVNAGAPAPASDRPAPAKARATPPRVVRVEAVRRLSAGMLRIVLGGDGLDGFAAGTFADEYVKLHFPAAQASYRPPFDPAELRATLPREQWPRTRSYTVRGWDPGSRRLTVDFVVHGDRGVAGPWALAARPGDLLQLTGPGGSYRPDPEIGCHLLVGDESTLPAIAVSLERMPPGGRVLAVIQVPGRDHRLALEPPARGEVRWIDGGGEDDVLREVEGLELPADDVQAFVHGEAAMVRAVRRHLLLDRGVAAERLSASGYWKRGRDDEGWRAEKPEWNRLAAADLGA